MARTKKPAKKLRYDGVITLLWPDGEAPGKTIEDRVRREIETSLFEISKPSDLTLHSLLLTSSVSGPSVVIVGHYDSEAFHCFYQEKTECL